MEQLEQIFKLNVFGAYSCATKAAKKFIELGVKGSIVFTASMVSYRPNRAAPSAPYGGTKAAIRNMTHTLAMEWAQHGIRVNSISTYRRQARPLPRPVLISFEQALDLYERP